jgi:hypothetical protein
MDFKIEFYKKSMKQECADYCPLECDLETYSTSISSLPIFNESTNVVIYYKSLRFTFITQEPVMDLSDFFSNIGGILGLFLGIFFRFSN